MTFYRNISNSLFMPRPEYRKPLRTLKELAEEFGVTPTSLKMRMRYDPEGPKPVMHTLGTGTQRNTWFDPEQVRAWWKVEGLRVIPPRKKQQPAELGHE